MPFYHKIHCKYRGIRGFLTAYDYAIKYQYMLKEKAKKKARIIAFWQEHGLKATQDAFGTPKRTLYYWKSKLENSGGKLESLNDKSTAPKTKRVRIWPEEITEEIKRLRFSHPNLGKDKIYPLLEEYCQRNNLRMSLGQHRMY